ncbi:MAG: hypothetical protein LBS54_02175 [Dysgonamonadaceae bacterium]|nr:hypothetical protein [Dysgonamonadaceae bacterium]
MRAAHCAGVLRQCAQAVDDNERRQSMTMCAGIQRSPTPASEKHRRLRRRSPDACVGVFYAQAYNDNVCRLTTTMYAGLQ